MNYLLNILFIPFWVIQRLIPRKKTLWVMGAWYGEKYADNGRSLFEYVNKYEKEISTVWLSNNKTDIDYIRSLGCKAYDRKSLWAVIYSLHAGFIIYSSSKKDINKYFINGAKHINLWHAAPFKKVELGVVSSKRYRLKLKMLSLFLPWMNPYQIDHTIVLSKFFSNEMSNDFGVEEENVLITGFPRNDNLFLNKSSEIVGQIKEMYPMSKIIMYMPTFRDYNMAYNYFEGTNFEKFQSYLERTNSVFLFKGHYASKSTCDFSNYDRFLNYDNYKSNQELYLHIKEMDVLITDYSSIFHDFLLLDRPIIFTPFDLSIYIKSGRELHYVYNESVPGPICNNWDEVYNQLELLSKGLLSFGENNEMFKNRYHKYQDGKSSERVFQEIKNRYLN